MKTFNLSDWLPKETSPIHPLPSSHFPNFSLSGNEDIESVISRIETTHTDLTVNYSDWLDIGFAFSGELGEAGRDYYHRVSRFYPGYSLTDCNKQFDACLKSKGHGITMRTFYHLAKMAGTDLKGFQNLSGLEDETEPEDNLFNTPRLPESVYENLPSILRESADLFQDALEKDVFLIGAMAVISGCLPNIRGIYFDEPYSAHLYAFITAPAGSGKGKMKWARYFGQSIHDHLVENSQAAMDDYALRLEQYNNLTPKERQNEEKPREPLHKMFFIPANSSSSAFIQALSDNDFNAVIFETEADTLAGTFKQEWGNFSDVLRKAFHHERTSLFRRKDHEFIDIKDPHLAIALSGTPRQVQNMMPDVENGLFRRFLYYAFEDNSDFKNPFGSHRQVDYIEFFKAQGRRIFELYLELNRLQQPVVFSLSPEQAGYFTGQFDDMLKRSKLLLGNDLEANIKRLGLVTFRMAMILSALRMLDDGDLSGSLVCSDTDFTIALSIATTLEKHAVAVYKSLPNNGMKGTKLKYFEALPTQFDRQTFLKVAAELGIREKNAQKYINLFKQKLLKHEDHIYTKIMS